MTKTKTITLYHGTKAKNIKSIRKHGIKTGRDGEVDLVNMKRYAETYTDSGGYILKVVIPISLVKLDYSMYEEDKLIFATSKKTIPKKYIKGLSKVK